MWNYFDNIRLIILFTSDILCFKQSWELMPQRWLKLTKCQNPYFSQKLFPFSYSNSWNPSSIPMKCVHFNTHVQFPFIYIREGLGGMLILDICRIIIYVNRPLYVAGLGYAASKAYWHFIMLHQFGLAFQLKFILLGNFQLKQIRLRDHIFGKYQADFPTVYYFLLELLPLHQSIFERRNWELGFQILLPCIITWSF